MAKQSKKQSGHSADKIVAELKTQHLLEHLEKSYEEFKVYADRCRKEIEEYKKENGLL